MNDSAKRVCVELIRPVHLKKRPNNFEKKPRFRSSSSAASAAFCFSRAANRSASSFSASTRLPMSVKKGLSVILVKRVITEVIDERDRMDGV